MNQEDRFISILVKQNLTIEISETEEIKRLREQDPILQKIIKEIQEIPLGFASRRFRLPLGIFQFLTGVAPIAAFALNYHPAEISAAVGAVNLGLFAKYYADIQTLKKAVYDKLQEYTKTVDQKGIFQLVLNSNKTQLIGPGEKFQDFKEIKIFVEPQPLTQRTKKVSIEVKPEKFPEIKEAKETPKKEVLQEITQKVLNRQSSDPSTPKVRPSNFDYKEEVDVKVIASLTSFKGYDFP